MTDETGTWMKYLDEETIGLLEDLLVEGWDEWAFCAQIGDALFFAPDDATTGEVQSFNAQAAKVCARCPVQAECLASSLMTLNGTPLGVWAGLSELQRWNLRKGGLPEIRKKVEQLLEAADQLARRTAA